MPRLATRALSAARHEQMARMLADGARVQEIAEHFGVTRSSVRYSLLRCGKRIQEQARSSVRNVHESMTDPEWDGLCMHHRALEDACRERAQWLQGWWQVCEKHRRHKKREKRIDTRGAGVAS